MSVKVARMQNGEDVIADIKEVRAQADAPQPIAYEFVNAFSVIIQESEESKAPQYLIEGQVTPVQEIDLANSQLKLYPWSPLTLGRNIVTINSVVSLGDPHKNVLKVYSDALEKLRPTNMSIYQDACN